MFNTIQYLDNAILKVINSWHTPVLDKVMPFITYLGTLGIVWIIIALLLLISKKYRKEGIMVLASLLLVTILGEGIIKHLIQRARPCADVPAAKLLIAKPLTYSFPSGHTASSFAAAGVFINRIKKYRVYAVILAILIAFSRLYLYVHYPSDVLAGMLLGLASAAVIEAVYKNRFSKK